MKNLYHIVVLPGDGIGPEVIEQATACLSIIEKVMGITFNLTPIPCGGKYYLEHNIEWPVDAFAQCHTADAILLGAVGYEINGQLVMTKPKQPYPNPQLAGYAAVIGNRQKLKLYANVRPIKLYPGIRHKIGKQFKQVWLPQQVDYIIVRENTEDAYTGESEQLNDKVVTPIQISRQATERIVRFAFKLAQQRNTKLKVTCVDKANIIGAHRYFRDIFTEIGKNEFPNIQRDYAYVDAFCQWQIQQPENYDVVVAPNLVGDIISDVGAATQGGLGMAASANIGDNHAMFEPVHGSAPQLAGTNRANPIAAILSLGMMLEWLAEKNACSQLSAAADCLEKAVTIVIQQSILIEDLTSREKSVSTTLIGKFIRDEFQKNLISTVNKKANL